MRETTNITINFTDVPRENAELVQGLVFAVSALAHGIQSKVQTAPKRGRKPGRKPSKKVGRKPRVRQVEERAKLVPTRQQIMPPKPGGVRVPKLDPEALKNLAMRAKPVKRA